MHTFTAGLWEALRASLTMFNNYFNVSDTVLEHESVRAFSILSQVLSCFKLSTNNQPCSFSFYISNPTYPTHFLVTKVFLSLVYNIKLCVGTCSCGAFHVKQKCSLVYGPFIARVPQVYCHL